MQKAKKYDWKDSNMALFGSDTEKKVKKESAESEPAWQGAGQEPGVQIWRIVKFQVTHWDKDQYGEFYSGDSYILLNTYKEEDSDELKYDVHFWIGKYSTQDEYGTAAYKTVELDTFLDDKPIQHREVQGHESKLFKSYFDAITILKGGADTGFKRVLPEAYVTRLLHIQKQADKKITVNEVPAKIGNLKSGDVFIIDDGLQLFQWNGSECTHDEKFKASSEIAKIKEKRASAKSEVLEEDHTSKSHPALKKLKAGESKAKTAIQATKEMLKISDEEGSLKEVRLAEYGRNQLLSGDVFLVNNGEHCFVWIGKEASVDERKNAIPYASNYLSKTETPWLPVTVIGEGKETADFDASF